MESLKRIKNPAAVKNPLTSVPKPLKSDKGKLREVIGKTSDASKYIV